jgi:hypothetical protein
MACGTVRHTASNFYFLGTITPFSCGTIDGNHANVKASTTGNVFATIFSSTPVQRKPRITNFNWNTGSGSTPTNIIVNGAVAGEIDHNKFVEVVASHSIVENTNYGANIHDNEFETNTAPATIYICNINPCVANQIRIADNDLTQNIGTSIVIEGGGIIAITDNIIEGSTAGGMEFTAVNNLLALYYRNYNEANTSFDFKTDTNASVRLVAHFDSSLFASPIKAIILNSWSDVIVENSILDGSCVSTTAGSFVSGSYYSVNNLVFDRPVDCPSPTEVETTSIPYINGTFKMSGQLIGLPLQPPLAFGVLVPCNTANVGMGPIPIKDSNTNTLGANVTTTGALFAWIGCNGTNWTVMGK